MKFCIASPHKNQLWYDYRVYINLKESLESLGFLYEKNAKNRIYFLGGQQRKTYPDISCFDTEMNNLALVYSHFDKVDSLLGFKKVFVPSEHVKRYFELKRRASKRFFSPSNFLKNNSKLEILRPFSSLSLRKESKLFAPVDLCFVGSPRIRPIVEDIIPIVEKHKFSFDLYGPGWDKYEGNSNARNHVKKNSIDYNEFSDLASTSKIILVDHHEGMNTIGAVSHKYVDHIMSGAFVISDNNKDARNYYGGYVYESAEHLEELIVTAISDSRYRNEIASSQQQIVKEQTSLNAAKRISQYFIE